jgi:electron transport complex protein RnfB
LADPASVQAIDALLPQTQCGRCGYGGCRPYAEALAAGATELNRCPPGGAATIDKLAALLRRPALPLDPACGVEAPPRVAQIDEALCIGCFKCVAACPVDAIVGAPKLMHTVLAAECTGCELCVAPCPVDCIAMVEPATPAARQADPDRARARFEARTARLARDAAERRAQLAAKASALKPRGGT